MYLWFSRVVSSAQIRKCLYNSRLRPFNHHPKCVALSKSGYTCSGFLDWWREVIEAWANDLTGERRDPQAGPGHRGASS